MSLGILARQGPSPIETYASDEQNHERIAVELNLDLDLDWGSGFCGPLVVKKAWEKGRGSGREIRLIREPRKRREDKKGKEDKDGQKEDERGEKEDKTGAHDP